MWAVVKPLRPHPLSVGQARNFCTRRLTSVLDGREDASDLIADVTAIASELVTNAVTAGSTEIELYLSVEPPRVRIEVADDSSAPVVPTTPLPTDPKGRGLMVVAALSRQWGIGNDALGKHVWAELALAG